MVVTPAAISRVEKLWRSTSTSSCAKSAWLFTCTTANESFHAASTALLTLEGSEIAW